jgi:hypothetical protein
MEIQSAFFLRLESGRLVRVGSEHQVPRHLAISDVERALTALRQGRSIYLLAQPGNLARMKQLCVSEKTANATPKT